jgi:hypothetical protein
MRVARCSTLPRVRGRQQRPHNPRQFRQTISPGKDRIEAGCGKLVRSRLFAGRRETNNLRLGKDLPQGQSRLHASRLRHAQVEEDHVATGLPGLPDGCAAVACLAANPVGSVDLKERSDSTAHGGTFADDEESILSRRCHGSKSYYGSNSQGIADFCLFVSLKHLLSMSGFNPPRCSLWER